jgi:hypothetical protein
MTMTKLEDMTSKQLLEMHNARAPEDQKLASWKGKKSDLIERVRAFGVAAAEASARKPAENTIGASVRRLLQDETLSYDDIVQMVKAAHPEAETTARSVASIASVLRSKGVDVPRRRGGS